MVRGEFGAAAGVSVAVLRIDGEPGPVAVAVDEGVLAVDKGTLAVDETAVESKHSSRTLVVPGARVAVVGGAAFVDDVSGVP